MTTALVNLDVCVPNGQLLTNVGIDDINWMDVYEDPYGYGYTTTGEYSFNLNGVAAPVDGTSQFYFKIADTKIEVQDDMVLTYNLRADNELGKYVFVDLLFDDGQKLSDICGGAVKAQRGAVGEWAPVTFALPSSLEGKTISGVIIAYDHGTSGEFNAYVDDIAIQLADADADKLAEVISDASALIEGNRAENYTDSTVAALREAIAEAQAVLADSDATQEEIHAAYLSVLNAMNGLVAVENTSSGGNNPAPDSSGDDVPIPELGVNSSLWLWTVPLLAGTLLLLACKRRKA